MGKLEDARLVKRPSLRRVGWAAAGAVLVFVVALGSHRSSAIAGTAPSFAGFGTVASVVYSLALALGTAVIGAMLYLVLAAGVPRGEKEKRQPSAAYPVSLLAKVAALFIALALPATIVGLALWTRSPEVPAEPIWLHTPPASPDLASALPAGNSAPAGLKWWTFGALGIGVVGGALVAWLMLRSGKATKKEPQVKEKAAGVGDGVRAAVDISLEELSREPDPRKAVLGAYFNLEQALAHEGLERRPYETALEYLRRWVSQLALDLPAGEQLTWLFQQARFSSRPVSGAMKEQAIEALSVIRQELFGTRQE